MKQWKHAAIGLVLASATGLACAHTPVRAGDDFYGYANGHWEAATAIPEGATSWGVRSQLREDNLKKLVGLIGSADPRPWARKVANFHNAELDLATIERKGLAPIRPMLRDIAALKDKRALAAYLGRRLHTGADPLTFSAFDDEELFGLYVGPGLQDPTRNMPYLLQGGISLPSPAAYQEGDPGLDDYRRYIAAMLAQAGVKEAERKAQRIVALESRIASKHAPAAVSADLSKAGTLWRRADFRQQAAGLDWDACFDAAGLHASQAVGVWQPGAIAGIAALVASEPLDAWKDYLLFHALSANARYLPKAFSDRYFAFFDPIFIGPNQHRAYWDHVISHTNAEMPDAGRLFAERYYSTEAGDSVHRMVGHIVTAFERRIGQSSWMTPATRQRAIAKLQAMVIGVGHPASWRNSDRLRIKPDDAFGNVQRADAFKTQYQMAKVGTPVDRRAWIPNAELFGINVMPALNAITIPMTEMQPPFFDPRASDAANYGALGVRIARFVGLALGEQGSRFDAQGRYQPWWTLDDKANYQQAAAPLVAQFASYTPFADLAVNGQRTLDNNVADLMALAVAYDALTLARQGTQDKFADQRFFIAYAESMRLKSSEKSLRGQLAGSPLAPVMYRVATVRNLDAWYAAFDVTPDQALYLAPAARVRIW